MVFPTDIMDDDFKFSDPSAMFLLSGLNLLGGHRDIYRIAARIEISTTSNVSDDTISTSLVSTVINPKPIGTIIDYNICDRNAAVLFDGSIRTNQVPISKLVYKII